jgi:hypothetical protein
MRFSLKKSSVMLLIGIILGSQIAQADQAERDAQSRCSNQFVTFMSSLLSTDSAKDYWKDILVRNRCQQEDIFALDDEIESLTQEIREEYFDANRCNGESVQETQREVYEKKMEIYFVRHIVEVDESSYDSNDTASIQGADDIQALADALRPEMVEEFVEGKSSWNIEESDLDALMEEWKVRYENRVPQYLDCRASHWQDLADTWTEFVEDLNELGEMLNPRKCAQDDAECEIRNEYLETKEARQAETESRLGGLKNSSKGLFNGYFKKHIELKINNLDPKQAVNDFVNEITEDGGFVTTQDIAITYSDNLTAYSRELDQAELLGMYETLYNNAGAEITTELTAKLEELQSIIQASTNGGDYSLVQLKKQAKAVYNKQGKGKAGS